VLSPTPVYTVSRSTDKLDIFATDENGVIQTAAWEPSFSEWSEWRQVAGGVAAFGSHVTAVSRSTDKLDIFVSRVVFVLDGNNYVTTAGGVVTSAWEPGFADWRPWRLVADGGDANWASPVAAVSRNTDKLNIFATAANGVVQTAAWEPDFGADWHGWWPA
jgi:hypothetical protein